MIFGIAFAFLLIYGGLRGTIQSITWIVQWKKSQKWSSVHGKIIHSNLQSMLVPRGGRKSHNVDGSVRLVTAFTPDILYEYSVHTALFRSKQIFLGQHFPSSLSNSNDLVEKYPVGKDVNVFYDPDKPELAILERVPFKILFGYLAGSLLFICFGIAVLAQALQQ